MSRYWPSVPLLAAVLGVFMVPLSARANDRHFSYTYESAVLAPGEKEIEVWSTYRNGRDTRYTRFDERLEFEIGLLPGLQTSFYVNLTAVGQDVGGQLAKSTEVSVSNEWKWRLLDSSVDGIGFALYAEVTGGVDELELEGKLIIDKRFGPLLLAANFVAEHEWEYGIGETEKELKLDGFLAAGWFFTPRFMIGVEARNANIIADGTWEHSAFFLGPVVSYSGDGWWMTLTVLPQLPAFKQSEGGGTYVLTDYERFQARLLFSFHI
ncbi:MAG TPA: hypothetical protein VFD38_15945 [Myxococcaceae bacterium]|nr:hypothetical protein [Myxococcaceae bacterium]